MAKPLFNCAAAATRCFRFLAARFTALVVVLTLAGSVAGVLSATSSVVPATGGGGDVGNGIVLANGGTGAGGDPGNGIVRN